MSVHGRREFLEKYEVRQFIFEAQYETGYAVLLFFAFTFRALSTTKQLSCSRYLLYC